MKLYVWTNCCREFCCLVIAVVAESIEQARGLAMAQYPLEDDDRNKEVIEGLESEPDIFPVDVAGVVVNETE
jgi:hypothetical protein